jgi:hypothetical protein
LAGLSGAAAALGKPCLLWGPALSISAGWLLTQPTRLPWTRALANQLAQLFRHPGLQIGLMLLVSPLVVFGLLLPPEAGIPVHRSVRPTAPARVVPPNRTTYARTDRNTPVPLLFMAPREAAIGSETIEQQVLAEMATDYTLIKTAPADAGHNCHGWVFTAGKYFIDGDDVQPILDENGYQPVSSPQAGDLAIYRTDESSFVAHTAVVRIVTEEGVVLLESKWGHMGRYIHPPGKLRFAHPPTYYRSSRQGHLLSGLDSGLPPAVRPASVRSETSSATITQ